MTARQAVRAVAVLAASAVAGGATTWWLGRAAAAVSGNRTAPWIVGRASGITAYLLLVAVVSAGLLLAHPWRTRLSRPNQVTRIRLHVALTTFTLAFTVLHVVVLATDRYAGVGWRGAVLPMGAQFRPVAVTLGLIGLYSGLLSGATALLAGRVTARIWWPLHKAALLALVLIWAHAVLAGSDSPALVVGYVVTAAGILALAATRYMATTPGDRLAVAHPPAEGPPAARPTTARPTTVRPTLADLRRPL